MRPRRWVVAQLGAREHYAAARALHGRGLLLRLITDAYCAHGRWLFARGPTPLRAFASRYAPDLPPRLVTAYSLATAWRRLRAAARPTANLPSIYERFLAEGAHFGRRVAGTLAQLDLGRGDALFTYNTSALEPLRASRDRGIATVLAQIDPGRVEERLVQEERARWPGWETDPGHVPEAYFERIAAEWEAADRVLVNSRWAHEALVAQGVAPGKLRVVPLAFEAPHPARPRPVRRGALRVLWLGLVCLRKGVPYLVEAARQLLDRDLAFTIAGPLHIEPTAVSQPPNLRFVGRVTREQAAQLYAQADVFVLPTISDGFAITQLEAMAASLPVITTPRCGEVVTHGLNGLIVPPRDAYALAEALARLDDDRELLAAMSSEASLTARRFGLDRFALALDSIFQP